MEATSSNARTDVDKDAAVVDHAPYEDDSSISSDQTQDGVKRIEAISQTWTKWSLIVAYVG